MGVIDFLVEAAKRNYQINIVDGIEKDVLGRTYYADGYDGEGTIEVQDFGKYLDDFRGYGYKNEELSEIAEAVTRYVLGHEAGVEATKMAKLRKADNYTWKKEHSNGEMGYINALLKEGSLEGYVGLALHMDNDNTDDWTNEIGRYVRSKLNDQATREWVEYIKPMVDMVTGKGKPVKQKYTGKSLIDGAIGLVKDIVTAGKADDYPEDMQTVVA